MWCKRISFFIIMALVYVAIMVDYPNEAMKALGYNQALQFYAEAVSRHASIDIVYNPGLRTLRTASATRHIAAVIPGRDSDYPRLLDELLTRHYTAIVECSSLDTWHSSLLGQRYLQKMRASIYRVVVFDGGHHLPTLGLAPDIILIPQTNGFAAHAHMLDGIKTEQIVALARETDCPAIIVTVPRWGLVKDDKSLLAITEKILDSATIIRPAPDFSPQARTRVSSYGGMVFAYVNRDYIKHPELLTRQIDELGIRGVHKICLAFDYRYIELEPADELGRSLSRRYHVPVQRVNEPVKVANAILWSGE